MVASGNSAAVHSAGSSESGSVPIGATRRLGAVLWLSARFAATGLAQIAFRDEATLGLLIAVGAVVYVGSILALFGRRWLVSLVRG